MGNWNITIIGVGCHHNDREAIDADLAFDKFVKELAAMGQTVTHASFTSGGLTTPEDIEKRRIWKALGDTHKEPPEMKTL